MFRFIAIAWDASDEKACASGERLGAGWRERSAWEPALLRPGLQVFTLGAKAGINEAGHLHGGLGVVLGKVFRRRDLNATPRRYLMLTSAESTAIVESGGQSLVNDFWGRYVAIFQTTSGTSRVLRDPSGALPCFRLHHEGVSIVFSWLEDAIALLGELRPWTVHWDAFRAFLLGGKLAGRQTALEGVLQVLPGECIDLHLHDSFLLWDAVEIARRPSLCHASDAGEAVKRIRQCVLACTGSWAACFDSLLVRLSGGVDSSILFSCLAPGRTQADVLGVNYHSEGSDSDERVYARLTAARVGRDLVERERDPGFDLAQVLTAARTCEPVRYTGWLNGAADAKLAAAYGAPAIFTGAGGDSVFYEFPRWWPAADYLATRGLDAGFIAAAMDAARLGKLSVWRTMALAFKERISPSQLESESTVAAPLLSADVRNGGQDRRRFIHPSLRNATDLPIGKRTQTMSATYPITYYSPFEATAPELVNPLLSQPLVELCLSLPTYLLAQGGHGRALVRRAFASDLPPQIVNRRSKGGLSELVTEVLTRNIHDIRGMLLEGQLARRGLIDRANVEEILSGRPTALAGYANQVHGLVAAQAWLDRWAS